MTINALFIEYINGLMYNYKIFLSMFKMTNTVLNIQPVPWINGFNNITKNFIWNCDTFYQLPPSCHQLWPVFTTESLFFRHPFKQKKMYWNEL